MEELLRFVAIRAPEKLRATDNRRVFNLKTNSNFQGTLINAQAEKRPEIAQEFTNDDRFIATLLNNKLAQALLSVGEHFQREPAEDNHNLTVLRAATKVLGKTLDLEFDLDDETQIKRALKEVVDKDEWRNLRDDLSDSFLALSLHQSKNVNSIDEHMTVLRVINAIEKAIAESINNLDLTQLSKAVPGIDVHLFPEIIVPENITDKNSEEEDDLPAGDNSARDASRLNIAANYLLTLPCAKLEPVVIEEPVKIEVEDSDQKGAKIFVASSQKQVFQSINEAVLKEDTDPETGELIAARFEALGTRDVALATMALRQDEHQIYDRATPMRALNINGTSLMANHAYTFTNSDIRETLNLALNPVLPALPSIFGPEVFGILTQPRYGNLGIGDLMVVRQNLKAYTALDIAHIENVLQGESKEREHSRRRLTEETLFEESETKLEEERDTQTSERFELRSEVQEEVKETFKFDAGVKVTAKLGPFVELEADARFGYENAKTEGRKKASQYSKETTERASTRFSERVLERRERRIVEEIEERNKHSIDASGADGHISGVYQWVNKVYEAQVFNYGLRQMYEFFLPEPATFYIGSLISKGLSDGKTPVAPPPFTVTPNTLNRSNYKTFAGIYNASSVPTAPDEYVKVDLAQAGGPQDFDSSENGNVAAAFSVQLPDGYEYQGYRSRFRYTYRGDDPDFELSISDQYGDPGSVPVYVKGHRIVSWAIWVHVTCRATSEKMDDWRLKAWEALRDGHAQMQREYEEQVAAAAIQDGIEITGRNPLANERIIRDEVQRQCITAFANKSPAGNNGIPGSNLNINVDWAKAYKKGIYTRFMQQAFEWENVSYVFYPFYWARKSRWLELFNIEDVDPAFQSFLQSGMARVVVPVRPGFEEHVEHFRRTGKIWSGHKPPIVGDADFLSIAAEIKAQTGAPGDEVAVGDPWDLVLPTPLVLLRNQDTLPKWKKDDEGNWVEDNQSEE